MIFPCRPLTLVLFVSSSIIGTTGRAIPIPYAALTGSGSSHIVNRADTTEFVTKYDLFDRLNPPSAQEAQIDDETSPRLKSIAAIFQTMQTTSLSLTSALDIDQLPTTASSRSTSKSSSTTIVHGFTPTPFYFGGPGPVLLPSSILYQPLSSSSSNPTFNDVAPGSNSNSTIAPAKRLTVLGIVIVGMLVFTACVFLLMSPHNTFSGCTRRTVGKESRDSDAEEPEKVVLDMPTWVTVPAPFTLAKRPSLETINEGPPSEGRLRDTVIDVVAALSTSESHGHPTSKFSMCSSEYSPSSTYTCDLASNASTILDASSKQLSDAGSKPTKPIRPPRPPTTDSPALSDSVFLACSDSDQPYVIVAPTPLTYNELLLPDTFGVASPRKLLSSTEFAASHLGDASDYLSPGGKRSSQDSRHSRTKSAPSLGQRNRTSSSISPSKSFVSGTSDNSTMRKRECTCQKDKDELSLDDIEADSDVQESMIRRVTKHRRSRSASGWAYPSKGRRIRRPFKSKEE